MGPWEGASARVTARVPGSALVGLRYERPFDDVAVPHGADGWRVVPASYVTTEEGTGLVHLAPAFGEIDRQIGRENGLPWLNPVGPDGAFTNAVEGVAGRRGYCGAAFPTSTPTPTAGVAARRLSTGASRAGTSPRRPARTTCWRPT